MTAEPRDVEEIRRDLATEEGQGSSKRLSPTGRLVADVEPLLARLAAADRENAELRGEVNALSRVKDTDYQVIALDGEAHVVFRQATESWDEPPTDDLMGSVGDMIRMLETETQKARDLEAEIERLKKSIPWSAEANEALLKIGRQAGDANARADMATAERGQLLIELESAEARLEAVRGYVAMARATESTDWDTMQPATTCRRCGTEYHVGRWVNCPGPAASGTPDGGQS